MAAVIGMHEGTHATAVEARVVVITIPRVFARIVTEVDPARIKLDAKQSDTTGIVTGGYLTWRYLVRC